MLCPGFLGHLQDGRFIGLVDTGPVQFVLNQFGKSLLFCLGQRPEFINYPIQQGQCRFHTGRTKKLAKIAATRRPDLGRLNQETPSILY